MTRFQHKFFIVAIVFVSAFGILTEAEAATVQVENYVNVHSTTGQAGQNGRDGLPGKDGEDGADGRSSFSGDGQAVVNIKAAIDGETVIDIVKQASSSNEADVSVEAGVEVADLPITERPTLEMLLNKIRLILLDYVLAIF